MQLSFRHGIIRHAVPTFLRVQGQYVDLLVSDGPFMYTICDTNKDYLFSETQTVVNAWGPLPLGTDSFLYINIDTRTTERTFGYAEQAPVISSTPPLNPSVGQHWYNIATNTMFVWSVSGVWGRVMRMFICELSNGTIPISMGINSPSFLGTNVGLTSDAIAGSIMYDVEGYPLKSSNGFLTTVDNIRVSTTSSADVSIESIPVVATATETISAYSVVKFTGFGEVSLATPFSATQPTQFGIVDVSASHGQVVNVRVHGAVTNPAWNWTTAGVNAQLYVNNSGQLSTTTSMPQQAPVATVIDHNTVLIGTPSIINYTTISQSGSGGVPSTTSTAGVARISVPAADLTDPIVVGTNDPRLSDARTPLTHSHASTDITGLSAALAGKLNLSGGVLTGPLTLSANPVNNMEPATKQYADAIAQNITSIPPQSGNMGKLLTTDGSAMSWTDPVQYSLTPATNVVLGGVKVGSGLSIDNTGILSVNAQPQASSSQYGVVKIGTGLHIDGSGSLATDTPPVASTTSFGVIKVGSGLTIDGTGTLASTGVPIATPTTPGIVSVGSGLSVDGNGALSTDALQQATSSQYGVVKIGTGLHIDGTGTLVTDAQPIATTTTVGVVKVGTGLSINQDGVLVTNAQPYASSGTGGIVKVGSGLAIDGTGVLSTVIPYATDTVVGGIKVGSGLQIDGTGTLSATGGGPGSSYTLPAASDTLLGGIKVGSGLAIDGNGVLSATGGGSYTLPTATASVLGGVKIGTGLNVDGSGIISVPDLVVASSTTLGGVKVGAGLDIDGFGVLSTTGATYTLPPATTTVLGGVKVGSGLTVDVNGVIAMDTLPTASVSVKGAVKVGSGLSIDGNSVLSATPLATASASTLGGVKVGSGLTIDGSGVLSADAAGYTLPPATQTVLGGVKVGSGLEVDVNGAISLGSLPVASDTTAGVIKIGSGLSINGSGIVSTTAYPVATTSVAGIVIAGSGLTVNGSGTLDVIPYSLPTASNSVLGGIKLGSGMSVDVAGALTYALPTASDTVLGGIKVGTGLTIDGSGVVSVDPIGSATTSSSGVVRIGDNIAVAAGTISVPVASASVPGVVKVGSGISVAGDGTISVSGGGGGGSYTLPAATDTVLGGIKISTDLFMDGDNVCWVNWSQFSPPLGDQFNFGVVKVGTGLQINGVDGTLELAPGSGSLPHASDTVVGGVMIGENIQFNSSNGMIWVPMAGLQIAYNPATTQYEYMNLAGVVRITDANGITTDNNHALKLLPATLTTMGGVRNGGGYNVATDGRIVKNAGTDVIRAASYGSGRLARVPSSMQNVTIEPSTALTSGTDTLRIFIGNTSNLVDTVSLYGNSVYPIASGSYDSPFEVTAYIKNTSSTYSWPYTIDVAYTGVGNTPSAPVTSIASTKYYPAGAASGTVAADTTVKVVIRAIDNGATLLIEETVVSGVGTNWNPWFTPTYTQPGASTWSWETDATAVPTVATTVGTNISNDYAEIPIPALRVFNATYTTMYVSTSGYITFVSGSGANGFVTALGQPGISLFDSSVITYQGLTMTSCRYGTYSGYFRCRMTYVDSSTQTTILEVAIPTAGGNTIAVAFWSTDYTDWDTASNIGLTDGATYRGAIPPKASAYGWGSVIPSNAGQSTGSTNHVVITTAF